MKFAACNLQVYACGCDGRSFWKLVGVVFEYLDEKFSYTNVGVRLNKHF